MKKRGKLFFEGVRVYRVGFGAFNRGAAMTIPGIGIFIGKKYSNDKNLLKHEFGHILQYRKWGFFFFWFRVAPLSFFYALLSTIKKDYLSQSEYMSIWTEWSANFLSFIYFKGDFNSTNYQLFPIENAKKVKKYPKFAYNFLKFYDKLLA